MLILAVANMLMIGSAVPYFVEVVRGKTKPRVVMWFTWTMLTAIGAAATFASHAWPSAVLLTGDTLATGIITLAGLRYGDRRFERLDIACQAAAIAGAGLWWVSDSPLMAVCACIAIDLVGAVPSLKHCWQRPYEETWPTFMMSGLGAAGTLIATTSFNFTAVAYAAYLVGVNFAFVIVILLRHKYMVQGMPAELREL